MQVDREAIGARQTPPYCGPPRVRVAARKYMIPPAMGGTGRPTAGRPVYSGAGREAEQRRSVVTDRRDEEREREDARRREEDERRSDELKEAWRRNHPSRPEEDAERGPKKGRA